MLYRPGDWLNARRDLSGYRSFYPEDGYEKGIPMGSGHRGRLSDDLAWSVAIDEQNDSMIISASGHSFVIAAFGACTFR